LRTFLKNYFSHFVESFNSVYLIASVLFFLTIRLISFRLDYLPNLNFIFSTKSLLKDSFINGSLVFVDSAAVLLSLIDSVTIWVSLRSLVDQKLLIPYWLFTGWNLDSEIICCFLFSERLFHFAWNFSGISETHLILFSFQ